MAPLSVNHIGQLPAVNFQFNLKPGVALSQATKHIDDAAREIGLPDTMTFSYQGTAAAFQNSLRGSGHSAADCGAGDLSCPGHSL